MKKVLLFALMLTAGFCATSCSKDDDNNNNQQQTGENIPRADLSVFTDRLISVDELGQLKGVNIGEALDAVAPTVLSVQADDMEAAKAKFNELVDGFKNVTTNGNNITVVLKDADNKEQGKVYFKEGSGNTLATMTYEGFTLQGISELRFLSVWPASNAQSRYKLYQIVTVPSSGEGNPRGICIREYSGGTAGMIICPTSFESGYNNWRTNSCESTMQEMGRRVAALGASNVSSRLSAAGLYSDLTKYYWSNTKDVYVVDVGYHKVRLSDGDSKYVSSWEVALSNNNANNAYTYWFDANGNCW